MATPSPSVASLAPIGELPPDTPATDERRHPSGSIGVRPQPRRSGAAPSRRRPPRRCPRAAPPWLRASTRRNAAWSPASRSRLLPRAALIVADAQHAHRHRCHSRHPAQQGGFLARQAVRCHHARSPDSPQADVPAGPQRPHRAQAGDLHTDPSTHASTSSSSSQGRGPVGISDRGHELAAADNRRPHPRRALPPLARQP